MYQKEKYLHDLFWRVVCRKRFLENIFRIERIEERMDFEYWLTLDMKYNQLVRLADRAAYVFKRSYVFKEKVDKP